MTIEPDVGCATYSDARHVKDFCCCGWGMLWTCFGDALEMLTGRHKRNHYHQTSVLANGRLTHLRTFVRPVRVNASESERSYPEMVKIDFSPKLISRTPSSQPGADVSSTPKHLDDDAIRRTSNDSTNSNPCLERTAASGAIKSLQQQILR